MKVTFEKFVSQFGKHSDDGSLDVSGTLVEFQRMLEAFKAEHDEKMGRIEQAVEAVFNEYRKAIRTPDLTTLVMAKMGVAESEMDAVRKALSEYLHANSGSFGTGKKYGINKGQGNLAGVVRWSDVRDALSPRRTAE